jgi:hypothetical protein
VLGIAGISTMSQKYEQKAALIDERDRKLMKEVEEYYAQQEAEKQKEKAKIDRKKYWKVDDGTDIQEYERNIQKKFDEYQAYVKEIKATKFNEFDEIREYTP